MGNRILKESICTSDNIDQLSPVAENAFYRLMVNCDDYGRMDGRVKVLKSRLFPLKDITEDDMLSLLAELEKADLIKGYSVGGHPYLQMKTWDRHQQVRAKRSKYPSADEITCNQLISDDSKCPRNPIQSESKSESVSESFVADAEAAKIQNDHNKVLDAAQNAGFKGSPAERAGLLNLYAQHGLERMLNAINECMTHSAPTLAYLTAVLNGSGKKQKTDARDIHGYSQRDYSGEQEAAMNRLMTMAWGEDWEEKAAEDAAKKGGTG